MNESGADAAPGGFAANREPAQGRAVRRVAIVGPGLIGGSIGLALRASGGFHVTAVGRTPARAEAAVVAGAADDAAGSLEAGLREAEAVLLCVPLAAMPALLREVPERAPGAILVMDVAGVKTAVHRMAEAAWREAAAASGGTDGEGAGAGGSLPAYIGGHPMAGRAVSGLAAARADLFVDAPWVLTSADRDKPQDGAMIRGSADSGAAALAEAIVRACRARPLWMTPEAHDRAVALASHVPQAAATALAQSLGDVTAVAALAGGGLRDMTRLAASPAHVWVDVLLANREPVAEGLLAMERRLAELRRAIASGDAAAVARAFREANEARALLAASRGWPA